MSVYLESPETLSDIKMEISDTTNSLDSLGISPTLADDNKMSIRRIMKSESPPPPQRYTHQNNHNDHDDDDHTPSNGDADDGDSKPALSNGDDDDDDCNDGQLLDNRLSSQRRPKLLSFDTKDTQRNSIQRTLTSNHPLMTPDSESECSSRTDGLRPQQQKQQQNNFPDVVPQTERLLQHQQTCANDISTNNTVAARKALSNGIRGTMNKKLSATLLRAHSPDLLSSESEADVSQYHAAVNANFQTVALIPNMPMAAVSEVAAPKLTQRTGAEAPSVLARRNRKTCGTNGADDISSLDSISNHSFDDDEEHNLASLSPSSSLIDVLEDDDDDDDDDCEGPEFVNDDIIDYDDPYPDATTPTPNHQLQQQQQQKHQHIQCTTTEGCNGEATTPEANSTDALPQYSAAEERRDSRNWQKITLPDGRTREIDMRVIEPYKRVLSHGGYLKAAGQNAIVIFCACHLPDRARADYNYVMDNLFLYVVKTLEQLVTDDYVLIYLHGGTNRRNVPPFPWLKKCYQLLDRRLRKSLKNMYLVHPTFWIKSIVWMARPFVSSKFWRKLVYVRSLDELSTHVAVEKAAIPDKVKQYDAKHN